MGPAHSVHYSNAAEDFRCLVSINQRGLKDARSELHHDPASACMPKERPSKPPEINATVCAELETDDKNRKKRQLSRLRKQKRGTKLGLAVAKSITEADGKQEDRPRRVGAPGKYTNANVRGTLSEDVRREIGSGLWRAPQAKTCGKCGPRRRLRTRDAHRRSESRDPTCATRCVAAVTFHVW